LKKDYIPGLGNIIEFGIIKEARDVKDEQEIDIGKL
jgi:hypothetical protein